MEERCDEVQRVSSRTGKPRRSETRFNSCILHLQPFAKMPPLTEYELERQANIERNQQLLKSMGILNAEVAPSRKVVRLEPQNKQQLR